MRKILLSALLSTVYTGSVLAEVSTSALNGFYLGGGLNYTNEKVKATGTFTAPGVNQSQSGSGSLKGGGVKIFAGYGALVSQGLYLGGELTLGFDQIVGSRDNNFPSNKKINYGIAGRVGYAFSTALPYVKFGYEGRPSLKGSRQGVGFTLRRSGFILGGGVDVAVNKNVFIRGEYVHGFGAKSNASANGAVNGVNVTVNVNAKTSSDTFLLGAAYKF